MVIQTIIRMSQARKSFYLKRDAANVIICFCRAFQERKRCRRALEELKVQKANDLRKAEMKRKKKKSEQKKLDRELREVEIKTDNDTREAQSAPAAKKFAAPATDSNVAQTELAPTQRPSQSQLPIDDISIEAMRAKIEQQVRMEYEGKYKKRILELAMANAGLVKEIMKRRKNETLLRKKLQACAVELDRSYERFEETINKLKYENQRQIDAQEHQYSGHVARFESELANLQDTHQQYHVPLNAQSRKEDFTDSRNVSGSQIEEFNDAIDTLMHLSAEANALPPVIGKHNKKEAVESQQRLEQCVRSLDVVKETFHQQQEMLGEKYGDRKSLRLVTNNDSSRPTQRTKPPQTFLGQRQQNLRDFIREEDP
eukprot:CAMPEP_0113472358 /NCGR_PEP_ID=MMETSP0014_2-20120614/17473_1 /TAXON_ID=2857 /ORGANISM="Nitzschia sp." /LENGTH=370 /DNA_ID=CAMNT_0000365063 /DNA_START=59 /DNA_END=1168 /DNA_ORIENTATION=- /assembly_acc=CAM_ASM_000159